MTHSVRRRRTSRPSTAKSGGGVTRAVLRLLRTRGCDGPIVAS